MQQSFRFPEPTLWALRKDGLRKRAARPPSLYEHLLGYEPIGAPEQDNPDQEGRLAVLNPQTGYMVNELANELMAESTPKA